MLPPAYRSRMREEKTFRLGRVRIDGDLIEFQPEAPLAFDAGPRDVLAVGVAYEYREVTQDREKARIRLTAHVDGQKPHVQEAVIGDNPLANDSRRGFLSVPIQSGRPGELRGRYLLEADYESGPWGRGERDVEAATREEGEFVVRVR